MRYGAEVAPNNKEKKTMRLTAKEAADRLGVSYVIAAGIMSHLEDVGKAKVVEKKFHSSGKGKPTRVYEVDQHTVIDFGADIAKPEVVVETKAEEDEVAVVAEVEEKIENLDHVAAALARLKSEAA